MFGEAGLPNPAAGAGVAGAAARGAFLGLSAFFFFGFVCGSGAGAGGSSGAFATAYSGFGSGAGVVFASSFSTGGGAGSDGGWGLGLRLNDVIGASCTVRFTTYAVADNDSDPFAVVFGEWIHIAATYNNGAINYFLNGVPLGGGDNSLFNNDGPNARLTIGARLGGNDVDQANGRLDGIRIYDEVLTPAQIQEAAVTSVVPEPAACGLMLLGAASVLRRRRRF